MYENMVIDNGELEDNVVIIRVNKHHFYVKKECLLSPKNYYINVNFSISDNAVTLFESAVGTTDVNEIFKTNKNINNTDQKFNFYDLYTAIRICEILGVREYCKQKLDNVFDLYSNEFTVLGVEYLYPIYLMRPTAVNWNKYFRYDPNPYSALIGGLGISEYQDGIVHRIKMIEFFVNFNISQVFESSDDETQAKLTKLKKQRDDVNEFFLIDPHEVLENNPQFMTFKPVTYQDRMKTEIDDNVVESMWGCDVLGVKLPEPNTPSIVNMETFQQRFAEYSCGVFEKSPNPEIDDTESFPWEGVVIAGGSIMQMLRGNYRPRKNSDMDIFIIGPSYAKNQQTLKNLVRWFKGPKTYFGIRSSVIYIYIEDIERTFQIVCTSTKTVYELIGRFDTSQIQCCYFKSRAYDKNIIHEYTFAENTILDIKSYCDRNYRTDPVVMCTVDALRTFNTGLTVLNPIAFRGSNPTRLIKSLISGFNIYYNQEFSTTVTDISKLYKNASTNPAWNDIINKLHTYWFPSTSIQTENNRDNYYFGMIQQTTNCTITTKDPAVVLGKAVLNGNFQVDYDASAFNTFHMASVRFVNPRSTFNTVVSSNMGPIVLTSPYCKILKFNVNHENDIIEINLNVEDAIFIDFIKNVIEGTMFRIFTPQRPTSNLLSENNTLKLNISLNAVRNLIKNEKSIIKNSKGEPLDIYEDVTEGDRIKFLFKMSVIVKYNQKRFVELHVVRIIKEVNGDDNKSDNDNDDNDNDIDDKINIDDDDNDNDKDGKKKHIAITIPDSQPEFVEASFPDI